jgi:exosome complex RNA-binding protein Rrp42 (RNase PH superfamily)
LTDDQYLSQASVIDQVIFRPSEEEVLISRTIEKALRRSRAVDTEGLCIVAGEKVILISIFG